MSQVLRVGQSVMLQWCKDGMGSRPLDWDTFTRGTMPWNADECLEVMRWYHNLQGTPKDDWDLRERSLLLKLEETGKVQKVQFNQFQPLNQLGFYMAQRYDSDVMPYYADRFMRIMDFLCEHREELKGDGLYREGGDDFDEICYPLLQALCELPYSRTQVLDGEECHTFDYDEVVKKTRALLEEYCDEDE